MIVISEKGKITLICDRYYKFGFQEKNLGNSIKQCTCIKNKSLKTIY